MAPSVSLEPHECVLVVRERELDSHVQDLTSALRALLGSPASLFVQKVTTPEEVKFHLKGANGTEALRELAGRVPVVPLFPRDDFGRATYWMSWYQSWKRVGPGRAAYHTTGFTVFRGAERDQSKLQLFRVEWAGVRGVGKGEPIYEAPGAGHPHWQVDAPGLLMRIGAAREEAYRSYLAELLEQDVPKLEEFEPEMVEAPEFSSGPPHPPQPLSIDDMRWTRMHFASCAFWHAAPLDGSSRSVRQHARGPASPAELRNWSVSVVRYLQQELQR